MNLPTKITVARMIMIPLVLLSFCLEGLWEYMFYVTAGLFIVASWTDFVDGYIARKYNMVTSLGKFLDPIADKVLVLCGLFIIVEAGYIPTPYVAMICGVIILAREFIVGLLRQIAALQDFVLAADNWGKLKTIATLSAITFLLFTPIPGKLGEVVNIIGYALFVLATILTVISGLNYVIKNKALFSEKKAAEVANGGDETASSPDGEAESTADTTDKNNDDTIKGEDDVTR